MKYRVKEYRKLRKLTQENLGNMVGISQEQIARIESGTCDMTLKQMDKIAKALGVKPYELLPEEWQPEPITPAEQQILDMIRKTATADNAQTENKKAE